MTSKKKLFANRRLILAFHLSTPMYVNWFCLSACPEWGINKEKKLILTVELSESTTKFLATAELSATQEGR